MANKWIGMGRLTADAETRYSQTANGSLATSRFKLAVDRRGKKEGDSQTADFIPCVSFGHTAEFLEKYGKKGTKFYVEGRIQTGSYEKDGKKIYTTDVVVEQVEFAESKATSDNGGKPQEAPKAAPKDSEWMNIPDGLDAELPFN